MLKLKNILTIILLLASTLAIAQQVTVGEQVYFTTEISEDASPAVLERVLSANEKRISKILFEKGTYHFYPDKAYEVYSNISNHDDVIVYTAFPLLGFKNITIDGQGSTFIFHGRMVPFLIENSENITVTNVSIDWEVPFHSEGIIVANDEKNGTFDWKFTDEYPYEIRNKQLIFLKPYYEHTIGETILFDPERKAVMFDTEAYTAITTKSKTALQNNVDKITYKYKTDPLSKLHESWGIENNTWAEQLEPGLVRIHGHTKKLPPVGMVLTSKGNLSSNRMSPGFRVTYTDGFTAINVNVHHAGGMAIIVENSSDILLDNFNVTASNGRMVSTTADATHFIGCRGKVTLRNCTLKNMLDDGLNLHGVYQEIVDIKGDHVFGVRMGHFQQQGFTIGRENDTLGILRLSDSFFPNSKLTIKSIQKMNARYQIITVNEKLPSSINVGDLVENLDAYPELLVENCNISNNRARGILLSNPKKTIIQNNTFSTEMEPILIPVESGHWFEAGNAANVLIKNNVFKDGQHSGFNRGVIRFVTDDDNKNIAFTNIEIIDNTFNQFDNLILEIANTDGLLIKGNTITNSGSFPMLFSENSAIKIKTSKNIKLQKNNYRGKAKEIIEVDKEMLKLKFR
ncbi:right-handed parallel beta-helix repeat-containing protein [Zobellia uliginosa]|uniref:right-handed parallel beta-helix repeat-containing protein n=1 Tax=Zobellia uliginosa TaxID=143224 RepID=UPI001C07A2E8|nr:right-handed parallel beta-helix repeat-containing protein [Zobellia uliginosa]MBU2945747.1 right-handed parallel beta-helix repeat-containing protein [Zobellia uliginosa]